MQWLLLQYFCSVVLTYSKKFLRFLFVCLFIDEYVVPSLYSLFRVFNCYEWMFLKLIALNDSLLKIRFAVFFLHLRRFTKCSESVKFYWQLAYKISWDFNTSNKLKITFITETFRNIFSLTSIVLQTNKDFRIISSRASS